MSAPGELEPRQSSGAEASPDEGAWESAWGFWLIAAFAWLLTLYVGWTSLERFQLAQAASRFEITMGEVEAADLKSRGGTEQVNASVIVGYEVDGERYRLHTTGRDGKSDFRGTAEAFVAVHEVGNEVEVLYDPQSPSTASLTAKVDGTRGLGTTLTLLALSLGFTVWLLRRRG